MTTIQAQQEISKLLPELTTSQVEVLAIYVNISCLVSEKQEIQQILDFVKKNNKEA